MNTKNGYDPARYERMNHLIGRLTLPVGFLLTFVPLVILWLRFGIGPDLKALVQGIFSISVLMAPVSIVEVLTFSAMLGSGAMYMAYLSGNITNLKIPSAAMAMDLCDAAPATEEGEIVSTIAIAGSVLASEVIIVAGVLLLAPLGGALSHPTISPAFEQVLPALFGAIGAYYVLKEWKVAVAPIALAIGLKLVGDIPTALTIPVCVLASVLTARFLYTKGLVGKGSPA
ncbi:MAG: hypothetical protein KKA67_05320 [Spirochaetes bacterium]|nr:hypothetical protein [Spirochaetota bacterium]MBU1081961.1 hypothetical protein [Spirochaetota bacterium]